MGRSCAWLLCALLGCAAAEESPVSSSGGAGFGGWSSGQGGGSGAQAGSCHSTCGTPGCGACPTGRALVTVDNFRIDATEVTNADYAKFLAAAVATTTQPPECAFNSRFAPEHWPVGANQSNLPVVGIDQCDAAAFCRWMGRRLCGSRLDGGADSYTEPANVQLSAWVFACTAGGVRTYGFDGPFSAGRCNVAAAAPTGTPPPLDPVGTRAGCDAGFGGLFDLTGNVWEWVDACDKQTGATDRCRLRGGSAESGLADSVCGYDLVTTRAGGWEYVGFRCCAD